jgi:hypothetical protein
MGNDDYQMRAIGAEGGLFDTRPNTNVEDAALYPFVVRSPSVDRYGCIW